MSEPTYSTPELIADAGFFNIEDMMKMLGYTSRQGVYNFIKKANPSKRQIGKSVYYSRKDILRYIEENQDMDG
ncbi:MAG TPA: helix-turn-helix domain-containing protein [Desulfobacteraceae bacterium]|nr:helix-turn-helix domain-containing protein [Desulfobacteraceae bacterium]